MDVLSMKRKQQLTQAKLGDSASDLHARTPDEKFRQPGRAPFLNTLNATNWGSLNQFIDFKDGLHT